MNADFDLIYIVIIKLKKIQEANEKRAHVQALSKKTNNWIS